MKLFLRPLKIGALVHLQCLVYVRKTEESGWCFSLNLKMCYLLNTNISVATSRRRTASFWVITQRIAVTSCRRFGTTYRSHLQGSTTDRLYRYVGNKLPTLAAWQLRWAQFSSASLWKPKITHSVCYVNFFLQLDSPSGARPPHCRGVGITQTHHTW